MSLARNGRLTTLNLDDEQGKRARGEKYPRPVDISRKLALGASGRRASTYYFGRWQLSYWTRIFQAWRQEMDLLQRQQQAAAARNSPLLGQRLIVFMGNENGTIRRG